MQLPSTFAGTERYAIRGQIGSGGFGVVFRAFDNERGECVALKLLRHLDAARLYAFKREFRALADVAHPNLVALYELVSEGHDWFFTMELIDGRPFLDSLRDPADAQAVTVELAGDSEPLSRLRQRFAQLVEGATALHRSGQLHRDLKPSNALVTDAGRVVLLDFGLVKDIGPEGSVDERVVGTVPYMSPEQGFAERVTPASDFYSVGVMLYQALTGRLPHTGPLYDMLIAKRTSDPIPPHELCDVPRDLSELSLRLLCRDPEGRPDADEILRRLYAGAPSVRAAASAPSLRPASSLMGRADELGQLSRAFADAVDGTPTAVFVHGSSGMGKTALCAELARKLEIEGDAVVLRGACYERESVPYKALDNLMDALSSYLRRLPRIEAEQRMPREVKALARLFPVLERVESVAAFPRRAGEMADVAGLRERAIAGLRELLGRMRDHRPLLLLVDDVQWGDGDSARLLSDLLTEGCPPLMLLFCYRTEERDDGPFVGTLMETLSRQHGLSLREVEVGPLAFDDARALSATLVRRPGLGDEQVMALAAQLARESRGNPFFIHQLAGDLGEREADVISSGASVSLSEVLQRRLRVLDPRPRALLEVVAAAAGPIPELVASAAAGSSEARRDLSALRAAHLVRTSDARVTLYHHRIREAVMESIDAERLADIHLRLAEQLERTPGSDAEAIAEHYRQAGKSELAGTHATRAAAEAFDKLAFERAARLYEQALALRSGHEGALYERLAEALAHAGRGPDAARAYLQAIDAAPDRAVMLRCRAAEQYFFSGHVEKGTELFHQVLAATGLPALPKSEGRALLSFVRQRVGLRLRGMSFQLVDEERVDRAVLLRIDVCYSVSAVLAGIRPLAATALQTHHLMLALEAGEAYRVCRGLVLEAIFSGMQGVDGLSRARELSSQARDVARRVDGPAADAIVTLGEGVVAYFSGEFRASIARLREAEAIISERCPGLSFELGQVRSFLSLAMFYTGDYAEAGRRMRPVLKATRARGDRYAESMIVNVSYRHELMLDRLDEAREEVARGLSGWYQGGWSPGSWARGGTTVQEFYERVAQIRIALYAEQASRAWALSDEAYKPIIFSPLGRIELIRIETSQLRGQAAVMRACHEPPGRRAPLLEVAGKMADDIERGPRWARPLAMLLRAALAVLRGDAARGSAWLADAELMAREHDMEGFAHAALWRRGQLMGDAAMSARAESWMRQQEIANPARFAALLAPGFEPT